MLSAFWSSCGRHRWWGRQEVVMGCLPEAECMCWGAWGGGCLACWVYPRCWTQRRLPLALGGQGELTIAIMVALTMIMC